MKAIFNNVKAFDTPKPVKLIERILHISNKKDLTVLDSFSGSGTTAHAILNLNKQDGGNRKFILVEMEDYANDITAERVKRVSKGYGEGTKQVEGTGGSFDYYELGKPLFDEYGNLNETVEIEKIREYVWYSETRSSNIDTTPETKYHLGIHENTSYFFVYEKDALTTLDFEFLSTIKGKAEQYIIYADNCLLPKKYMAEKNIVFKKIPRDISRF